MEPWIIAMICATILIRMGTCITCCHKRRKSYVTDKEAKLRDRALGQAKELVHIGAHRADKLLKDVQTYHDKNHEIVTQKKHQITLPLTEEGLRTCPAITLKPRHMAVGYSSSSQERTVLRESRQTDSSQ
jgi:hypothetical protein